VREQPWVQEGSSDPVKRANTIQPDLKDAKGDAVTPLRLEMGFCDESVNSC
jgi:hypothetical protein